MTRMLSAAVMSIVVGAAGAGERPAQPKEGTSRWSATQQAALPAGTIQVPAGTGSWVEAPRTLPPGAQMLLLEGHPGRTGMFTMRLRLRAGARIQPHWHPAEERVTILSGRARVGFGETFDEERMATFEPGSFYLNPAKSHHYVLIVEDTEMQLTGQGPWELHPVGQK